MSKPSSLTALIVFAAILSTAIPASGAWIENPATGHYYQLTSTAMVWADAEAEAVSLGGHLVTINDQAEQTWLNDTFGRSLTPLPGADGSFLWIGFNDIATEGTWVWVSGEAVTYTDWYAGSGSTTWYEPNNDRGIEDVGVLGFYWNYGSDGWNDLPVDNVAYGIIESAVPEPATMLMLGALGVGMAAARKRGRKKAD